SPLYHHFIDAKTFGSRFGLSTRTLHSISQVLAADGVRITGSYPQRTAIDARAPARLVERLFGVTMMDYVAPDGRRFHAPTVAPAVPASLAGAVTAVDGLDQRHPPVAA